MRALAAWENELNNCDDLIESVATAECKTSSKVLTILMMLLMMLLILAADKVMESSEETEIKDGNISECV